MTATATLSRPVPTWVYQLLEDQESEYFAVTGGLGSGKTTGGTIAFLKAVLNNPTVLQWWAVALTHTKADDTLLPSFIFVLTELFQLKPDDHFKILREKPIKIKIPSTGQTIALHSGDRPENMVGTNIGGYFITEAGLQKRAVWENCTARARDKRANKIIRILEGTPEGDNYFREQFDIDKIDREKKYRRFILHTDDNLHNLASSYIEQLERVYDQTRLKSYRWGLFTSFNTGDVFENYVESRNVAEVEADPFLPIDLCFDFNYTPLTWSAWQNQIFVEKGIRVKKECCVNESSLDCTGLMQAAIEFGLKFPPAKFKNTPIYVYGDRTGHARSHKTDGTDYSNLKKYLSETYSNVTIKAAREVTPIRASVDVMNRMFLYERMVIATDCKNMRAGLRGCKWAAGKADIDKPQGETHTHHPDGARYRNYAKYKDTDFSNVDNINKALGANWV